MDYSKKELAAKFGVTTQALDKRINKLGLREKCVKDGSNRLWIPEEIAEILAKSYEKRFQEVDTSFKPDETDWKELYLREKERNDSLSDRLMALTESNQELNDKIIRLLGNEKLLDQAERAKGLFGETAPDGGIGEEIIDAEVIPPAAVQEETEPEQGPVFTQADVNKAVTEEVSRIRGMSFFEKLRWFF